MTSNATKRHGVKEVAEWAGAYLAKMPVAIEGAGGDRVTFNAAHALVRGFSLSVEKALPLLLEWNKGCQPPWSEADLRAKLRSAVTSAGRPHGYLLEGIPDSKRDRTAPDMQNEAERRAWQRRQWPELRRLTREELQGIARMRGIPWDGLNIASHFGLIKGARYEGHECFVIGEGRFAQVRRCDGQPLTNADGKAIKAKNLPGSEGAFVGRGLLSQVPNVLLVEGAIGLLEALTAYALVDMEKSWTVLAATSASSRLATRDPALLRALSVRRDHRGDIIRCDRHIRIVPDMDTAGMNAAASWLADLRQAGLSVDIQELPEGCKDLGSLLKTAEINHTELDLIFQ
jgi:hypothetical protein